MWYFLKLIQVFPSTLMEELNDYSVSPELTVVLL